MVYSLREKHCHTEYMIILVHTILEANSGMANILLSKVMLFKSSQETQGAGVT